MPAATPHTLANLAGADGQILAHTGCHQLALPRVETLQDVLTLAHATMVVVCLHMYTLYSRATLLVITAKNQQLLWQQQT